MLDVRQLLAQQLVVPEPGLGDVDDRAKAVGRVAVDDVDVDPGVGRALDLLRVGIGREDDHGAGRDVPQGGRAREKGIIGVRCVADDQIGRALDDAFDHVAVVGDADHLDADRPEVILQGRGTDAAGGYHEG